MAVLTMFMESSFPCIITTTASIIFLISKKQTRSGMVGDSSRWANGGLGVGFQWNQCLPNRTFKIRKYEPTSKLSDSGKQPCFAVGVCQWRKEAFWCFAVYWQGHFCAPFRWIFFPKGKGVLGKHTVAQWCRPLSRYVVSGFNKYMSNNILTKKHWKPKE